LIWLVALIVLYIITRLAFLLCLPMGDAPDELYHLTVAEFLKMYGRLPTLAEVKAGGDHFVYGTLPALGYVPNSILGFIGSYALPDTPFRLVSRFGTMLAGLPGVIAAYYAGRELFGRRISSLVLPLLVVFHPQLAFTEGYTNTDALVSSLCSINFYLVAKGYRMPTTVPIAAFMGFLTGWAVLSKTNALAVVPALMLAVYMTGKKPWQALIAFCGMAGVLVVPYWLRNYFAQKGDVLGSRTMYENWIKILPRKDGQVVHPWPALHTIGWWRYMLFDFFGLYGLMDKYLWRPFYFIFLGGVVLALWGHIKTRYTWGVLQRGPLGIYALALLLNFAATIYATYSNTTGPHGRYLFPCEIPIFALMLSGFERLGTKATMWLSCAMIGLFAMAMSMGWIWYYSMHQWFE
jgi:hypothetical protein